MFEREYDEEAEEYMNTAYRADHAGIRDCMDYAIWSINGVGPDGEPAVFHSLRVGMMGRNDKERMAGFLHDIMEDGDGYDEELVSLLRMNVDIDVIDVVVLLTRDKGTDYFDYVQTLSTRATA